MVPPPNNMFVNYIPYHLCDMIILGDMMNKLKDLRAEFYYTLRDLENKVNIPRSNLNLIELGKLFTKNVEKIYELCEFFQVSFDYFWGKSDQGIYVKYQHTICSLDEKRFLKYKELGYIVYKEKERVLTLPHDLEISFVHNQYSLIEVFNKKD